MGIISKYKKYKWIIATVLKAPWSLKKALVKGFREKKDHYYPPNYEEREADIKKLIYCMLCPNMCRFECPAVNATKREAHAPAGKARIAYYLEMDRLEKTPENILPLFEGCVHCHACREWCPFDFSVGDLLEGVAADLLAANSTLPEVKAFDETLREKESLYEPDEYRTAKQILETKMKTGEIYYFPGCVTMAHTPSTIEAIVKISEKAGEPLQSNPGTRVCCGAPSIYGGDFETAKELARKNAEYINQLGVKAMVCECPECAYTFKEQYPKFEATIEVPVLHVTEWIQQLLAEGKISLKKETDPKDELVSYHDPCLLARKLKVTEPPRVILQTIYPENFQEVHYNRKETHCCGFGGLENVVNPDLADKISKKRLAEFDQVGASTIVTCCPTCELSLLRNNEDVRFEIKDITELVAEHLE